jgi:hypothetical protein
VLEKICTNASDNADSSTASITSQCYKKLIKSASKMNLNRSSKKKTSNSEKNTKSEELNQTKTESEQDTPTSSSSYYKIENEGHHSNSQEEPVTLLCSSYNSGPMRVESVCDVKTNQDGGDFSLSSSSLSSWSWDSSEDSTSYSSSLTSTSKASSEKDYKTQNQFYDIFLS